MTPVAGAPVLWRVHIGQIVKMLNFNEIFQYTSGYKAD